MIRRPPRSTQSRLSAASDVYKRQIMKCAVFDREHIAASHIRRRKKLLHGVLLLIFRIMYWCKYWSGRKHGRGRLSTAEHRTTVPGINKLCEPRFWAFLLASVAPGCTKPTTKSLPLFYCIVPKSRSLNARLSSPPLIATPRTRQKSRIRQYHERYHRKKQK